ncbi:hypothetical protein KBB96_13900 [Luteolibacter ambystomatis]|uniref:Transporter n=1 Tax=Luteolibacter ambystomatis TaxID=2824561 RepID=A0A975G6G2_9BACT|nr:TorF family putative porin [Luteolibacter ambystomatis]QUE49959.1 hypothetical protein KBB96_13900 [Luteolibacter ambystomatis]
MHTSHSFLGSLLTASALACVPVMAGTISSPATEPEPFLEGNLHIGYSSDYLFRGVDSGAGLAEAGLDVSKKLGSGFTLSGGLWYGSIENSAFGDFPGVGIPDHYSELDVYGQVSKDFGFLTASVGYIWYHYADASVEVPGGSFKFINDSQEISFGISRELFYGINAGLTYYWDIETDNGGYTELSLNKTFELQKCLTLDAGAKAGYLMEESGFSHVTPMLALNYKPTSTVTISPYIAYAFALDKLDTIAPNSHDHFFGGIKMAVSF